MCDEDVELYRRLCLEEGRVLRVNNQTPEVIPTRSEDVIEEQAAPACAPSPLPTERMVQPAVSPPPRELLAPPTPPPVEDLPSSAVESTIEFMKFQGEMEQVLGTEESRNEAEHIQLLEAMASKELNEAPVIEEIELVRSGITEPPGFELTPMMLLESVEEGSPADKAGFGNLIGHSLVTVNGVPVTEPEQLSSFWTETSLLFGFMDMTAGVGPSMATQLSTLNDMSDQKGYVFLRGTRDVDAIGALLGIHLPQGSDMKLLDFEKFTTGAVLLELPSQAEAEILASSLHHSIVKGGDTISAFMVFECRGQPTPKDVVEVINGVAINITAVFTNSPVSRPRKLDAWQPPPDDGCLEDGLAGIGEWDQFAANAALGMPKSTYSEEAYTTKLDPSTLTQEQREASKRLAAEIGESANDSTLNPDGEGDQRDEEALHSAVLRDESKFRVKSSVYVLLGGLEATQLTEESLKDIVEDFDGGAEHAIVINNPKLAGVIKFKSLSGARQCITDLDGAALDDDHRLSAKHLFIQDDSNKSSSQTCILDGVPLCEEPNLIKQGTGMFAPKDGNTLEGSIGDWDQFAANKKLGIADSTYSEDLYTTKLVASEQDVVRAAKLAEEIGTSNKDSLMEADGEGDDDDEEARHSSVNPKTLANQPKTSPEVSYIFIRNIGTGTASQLNELFNRVGCPPISCQLLEIYRHPPGAALLKVHRENVRNALTLHGIDLPKTTMKLEVRLVFPSKVIDGDALTEEIDGVTIDIPT
eukprot:TRINITY_DN3893_c1_g1_i1.p1 TRINITY_DN3893_c1_g1~~TRINITY_DN3893_c1_g1_i1.p1  ORF type:complete len:807 (+),score=181.88 TRINITY_DN3893_c1_g1_i1:156-2423(+)